MEIEVLGAYGGETPECRLTCLLVGGTVAIDAGCLCRGLEIERQLEVEAIVLTHSHADHTNGLPFFLDNVFGRRKGGVTIRGSEATLYAVRKHVFNSSTWPDFTRLPNHLEPVLEFEAFDDEESFVLGNVTFTPIRVNHVVPTHGLLVESEGSAFLWSSDTGPTERLWEVANRTENLKGVGIDVSFHNQLQQVADDSGHLTPASLQAELAKFDRDVDVFIHHMKPQSEATIREEVAALGDRRLRFFEQGEVYRF